MPLDPDAIMVKLQGYSENVGESVKRGVGGKKRISLFSQLQAVYWAHSASAAATCAHEPSVALPSCDAASRATTSLPNSPANMAAAVDDGQLLKQATGRSTRGLLRVIILCLIAGAAVSSRLFSVIRFESIIHECMYWDEG
jgi:hypothetical protein